MEDQTNFLLAQGISAGLIGEDKVANARIDNGECCVVSTCSDCIGLPVLGSALRDHG